MDYEYAYNYWRKVFAENGKPHWGKNEFDEWFLGGAKPVIASIAYHGTIDKPGSKEHQYEVLKESFISMLEACERGDFSK